MRTNDEPIILRESDISRFWKYVRKTETCWLWIATIQQKGYGTLMLRPRRRCTTHRISWVIHHGQIPIGKWILHRCDTPACVNPDHLFLGDHISNMADARMKGRMKYSEEAKMRYRGENSGNAKLTEHQVREIRSLAGVIPQRIIATHFSVSKVTVKRIIGRKGWAHVT